MRYEMAPLAIEADRSERAAFIRRTYMHLAGAVGLFIAIEAVFFGLLRPGLDAAMAAYLHTPFSQLIVVFAFIGVSYLANYWAFRGGSPALQYAGLGLYVLAEAVIFVPLLYIATVYTADGGVHLIGQAGILTLCMLAGLTAVVFFTRKDFSFLGPILAIAGFVALGVIICAVVFGGFSLGLWFSIAMIVLASGSILYNTSNIMLHFRTDQHVAASLSLFASVAMLFYYILLALMQSRRS